MTLEVDLALGRPGFALEAAFRSEGKVTALFGRSGAGKSTIAGLIAGLIRPDRGRVLIDGTPLVDTEAGIFVPPHRRRIAVVFQDGRLFPHMSVRRNLLYAGWVRRRPSEAAGPVIELLGIGPLLPRRPATLSGGEKQRVAIGRALLAEPRLLVLDEPLASLDQTLKAEILPYLERLKDELGLPMVYVSHALDEVVRLADTLVLLEGGRIAAAGPVGQVMSRLDLGPGSGRTEAGAVVETRVSSIDRRHGLATLAFPGGRLYVPAEGLSPGAALRVHIRARDVAIAVEPPRGLSILNVLEGRIVEMTDCEESAVDLALEVGPTRLVARVTRLSADALGLAAGRPVHALIKSVAFDRRIAAPLGSLR